MENPRQIEEEESLARVFFSQRENTRKMLHGCYRRKKCFL